MSPVIAVTVRRASRNAWTGFIRHTDPSDDRVALRRTQAECIRDVEEHLAAIHQLDWRKRGPA